MVAQRKYPKKPTSRSKKLRYPPRKKITGKGAYYVSGGLYGKAKLGPFSAGGHLGAGYSKGYHKPPITSGVGAYSVESIRKNVLIKPESPEIRNAHYKEGAMIVRHREYICDIVTSDVAGQFKIQSFPLNPAQTKTFPWLASGIGPSFEEYQPNGMMFEFVSTCSNAIASSTNLALGQVTLCTQYDPTNPEFTSQSQMLQYFWAQTGKVSDNICHYIECDPKQSPLSHLYTRSGSFSNNTDLRFSDFGNFSIATSGLQGTSVQIGQLFVTYEFLLYKQKIASLEAVAGGWFHYCNRVGLDLTAPIGVAPKTNGVYDAENNLPIQLANSTDPYSGNFTIVLPKVQQPSTFQIDVVYSGTIGGMTLNTPFSVVSSSAHVSFIQHVDGNSSASVVGPQSGGATGDAAQTHKFGKWWVSVDPSDNEQQITFNQGSGIPNAPNSCDIYVVQIPYLNPSIYG